MTVTIGPDDYFEIAAGKPFDGTWQVEGEPGYWPMEMAAPAAFSFTATLVTVTKTTSNVGDVTTTETRQPVDGCLFAPRSSTERTDPRSPAVISGAAIYIPAAGVEVAVKRAG